MLISVAVLILLGLFLGQVMKRLHLPSLVGYLLTGILLGPSVLNVLSSEFLALSADFRELALIVILTRAGLSLDINELKKVGRPALLMCFVPAVAEIGATVLLAPVLFSFSISEALLLGSIVAAVSPAVVVPRMLKLIQEGYGREKHIPQIILAGASVDDVFVLVLFSAFLGMNQGSDFTASTLLQIPSSIISGLLVGAVVGWLLAKLFSMYHMRDSIKVLIMLSLCFLLMGLEDVLAGSFAFSGMLSVMSLSLMLYRFRKPVAQRLAVKFNKLWLAAEIFLFVLVGASVNIAFAYSAGWKPFVLILFVSGVRMLGVFLAVMGTNLTTKERIFCTISYLPKATVQAAIGGIPLALGINNGEMILTIAVISILTTAPIGALGIDLLYKKLLSKDTA
ncbi:cation:proton antiporter [Enterococcus sp. BWR-S5]|uniref:cation:proton antiporter n=1 Tax=Enterococcus sp. BWR-S5 TaxID=2787714 RepID=UPI0019225E63|nr:cation:proton antiporter [Enterococcus sp. BWR-S5]MBL1224434.1 cation:proton antiporter [Enterococcus sp. BWR-S5]